ncbi:MAG: hypothetical protein Q9179_007993 [Wetmoreana sp. 5 TL-2023]
MQDFLKSVQEEMNRLTDVEAKASSAAQQQQKSSQPTTASSTSSGISTPTRPTTFSGPGEGDKVNEHIGPIQFNMGGIQVDAEEMVRKLKEKGKKDEGGAAGEGAGAYGPGTPEGTKKQNEELAQFFAGLMERGKKGSPRVTRGEREGNGTPRGKGEGS